MPIAHVQCAPPVDLITVIIAAAAGCGLALAVVVLAVLTAWWAAPKIRCFISEGE